MDLTFCLQVGMSDISLDHFRSLTTILIFKYTALRVQLQSRFIPKPSAG